MMMTTMTMMTTAIVSFAAMAQASCPSAVSLDGATQHGGEVLTTTAAVQTLAHNQVTVSAWVKIRKHRTHNWVVGTTDRDAGFSMFVDAGEKVCFGLFQDKSLAKITSKGIASDPHGWHFVAATFDENKFMSVNVDGAPGDRVPMPEGKLAHATGISVGGAEDWAMLRLDGDVASVSIWNVARTQGELVADMVRSWDARVASLLASQGLLAHWPISEGQGTRASDAMGGPALAWTTPKAPKSAPVWVPSTAPHFIVGGGEQVDAQLVPPASGVAVHVSRLPPKGALLERAVPVYALPGEARRVALTLGFVHKLPWPLKPRRHLAFLPKRRPDGTVPPSTGNVTCTQFAVTCTWTSGVMADREVRVQVAAQPELTAAQIVHECKRQRYSHGVAHAKNGRLALTAIVALTANSPWMDEVRASRFVQATAGASKLPWELVVVHTPEAIATARAIADGVAGVSHVTVRAIPMVQTADVGAMLNLAVERARGRFVVALDARFEGDLAGLASSASKATPEVRFVVPERVEGSASWQLAPVSCERGAPLPAADGVGRDSVTATSSEAHALTAAAETRAIAAAAGAIGVQGADWRVLAPWACVSREAWREAGASFSADDWRNASASAAPAAVVDWYRDLARRVLLASSEAERAAEATVRLNKVVAVAPGCAVRSLV